ncbi:MAG: GNAT family N-acetyltransferase [Lachnospiraceae bacterium]|jgi:putative acetyltransferase|nr:GNAT family N-acetyltransferase [Lachnospiraceae bacterium]
MIRNFKSADINTVMSIWLNANKDAHDFIDAAYWENHFDAVKMMIPQAEVYVSERNGKVSGFIGLAGNDIAGIFVEQSERAKGMGSELLNFAQKERGRLNLNVYKKNVSAVNFYKRRGFKIVAENMDMETTEIEYHMTWKAE